MGVLRSEAHAGAKARAQKQLPQEQQQQQQQQPGLPPSPAAAAAAPPPTAGVRLGVVRAVGKAVWGLGTVRGRKTVVKFFPHEPADLEPW